MVAIAAVLLVMTLNSAVASASVTLILLIELPVTVNNPCDVEAPNWIAQLEVFVVASANEMF
jgi:hypothetical protein